MSDRPAVLVTGGCGYIGSHVVRDLLDAGYAPAVLDDLSTGKRESLPSQASFYRGSCGDPELIRTIKRETGFQRVVHFAASIVVPKSITDPLPYYQNNVANTLILLQELSALRVDKFVLSSSAAVYGDKRDVAISEDAETRPVHPYGRTKLIDEWMLRDLAVTGAMRYVILRYFNVAGADPKLRAGQCSPVATHLIKVAAEAAVGLRSEVTVYGHHYPTPDGTCVRDYVHVSDLSSAHVKAVQYLDRRQESMVLNCGYGRGYSVKDVLDVVLRHARRPFRIKMGPQRPGDVPSLVAGADRISRVLGWDPVHDSLDQIVRTSVAWEAALKDASGLWPSQTI